jgi:hypothetical protein
MALNANLVEQLANWCLTNDALAEVRAKARNDFFGYDEPGEVDYMAGAGDVTSRERRFLGWFMLTFKMPDGRNPAELAASSILSGSELTYAIDSLKKTRHVLATVSMVSPGRGLVLKLEDEEFTVENRLLSRAFDRGDAIYAHLIPAGRRGWLVGPGWLQWPIGILPGMQTMLKSFQFDPIQAERFLQQRIDPSKDRPKRDIPGDSSLRAAVARMTKAARAEDRQGLIMTQAQWKKLVTPYITSSRINEFIQEIIKRVGAVESVEAANKWIGLAMKIWNNTPQPDRGGKSPLEIQRESDTDLGC